MTDNLLKHHEAKHEQLTDDMVNYAKQLKEKALKTTEIVAKSVQVCGERPIV